MKRKADKEIMIMVCKKRKIYIPFRGSNKRNRFNNSVCAINKRQKMYIRPCTHSNNSICRIYDCSGFVTNSSCSVVVPSYIS